MPQPALQTACRRLGAAGVYAVAERRLRPGARGGRRVPPASDGNTALALARRERPDLIALAGPLAKPHTAEELAAAVTGRRVGRPTAG